MLIPMIVMMIRKSQNKKISKAEFCFWQLWDHVWLFWLYWFLCSMPGRNFSIHLCFNQLLSWTRSFQLPPLSPFFLSQWISASASGSASASVRHLSPSSPTASAPRLLLWWFCLLHTPTSGWRKSLTLRIYIYISHLVTTGEDKFVS